MKSNILLAIGISLVVMLGALSAFQNQATNKSASSPIQKELAVQIAEN